MMLFSDMGGIDIEQVAEEHPDHVGRGHLSNLQPDLRLPGQAGRSPRVGDDRLASSTAPPPSSPASPGCSATTT